MIITGLRAEIWFRDFQNIRMSVNHSIKTFGAVKNNNKQRKIIKTELGIFSTNEIIYEKNEIKKSLMNV